MAQIALKNTDFHGEGIAIADISDSSASNVVYLDSEQALLVATMGHARSEALLDEDFCPKAICKAAHKDLSEVIGQLHNGCCEVGLVGDDGFFDFESDDFENNF